MVNTVEPFLASTASVPNPPAVGTSPTPVDGSFASSDRDEASDAVAESLSRNLQFIADATGAFNLSDRRGNYYLFGAGQDARGVDRGPGVLFLLNFLPQPVGYVPSDFYGLEGDWLRKIGAAALPHALGPPDPPPMFRWNPGSEVPVVLVEISPSGVVLQSIKGWLVDP